MHSAWQHTLLNAVMIATAQYGLVISVAAFTLGIIRSRRYDVLAWMAAAALLAAGLSFVASFEWFDPRPFTVLHVTPLIGHPPDNGFPSDHSTVAAFVAGALWFVDVRLALVAAFAALAIGIARVYCLLHWPVDIAGGWCLGALPALAAGYGWRRYGSFARHDRV